MTCSYGNPVNHAMQYLRVIEHVTELGEQETSAVTKVGNDSDWSRKNGLWSIVLREIDDLAFLLRKINLSLSRKRE